MKLFKVFIALAIIGGLFYLANRFYFDGKMVEEVSSYVQSGKLESTIASFKEETNNALKERAYNNKPKKPESERDKIEEYRPEDKKIITDAIDQYLK